MDIQCRCTACSATFRVAAAAAGKKARCPKCSAVVDVPAEAAAKPLMPPPAKRGPPVPPPPPSVIPPAVKSAPPVVKNTPPVIPPALPPPPALDPAPPNKSEPASEAPATSGIEFPSIVTGSKKAAKTSEPSFVFPEPATPATAAGDSSVLGDGLPAAEDAPPTSEGADAGAEAPAEFSLSTAPSVTRSATPAKADKPQKRGKSLSPLFIGGGVLALLVIVGGALGVTAMLGGFGGKSAKVKPATGAAT